jgi:response regulator RpfG family c-di-GMP phosphodiesterase
MHAGKQTESVQQTDPPQPSAHYTVFLVDDSRDDLHHMTAILRTSPYIGSVMCFRSAEDMKKHFMIEGYYSGTSQMHRNMIILLDVHMPGLDGLTMLQELKEHPHTAEIPVLLTTSDMSHELENHAQDLRVDGLIPKPMDINHIHDVLRRHGHDIPRCLSRSA